MRVCQPLGVVRDPSHHHALSVDEWRTVFSAAGLRVLHAETAPKRMAFQPWAERMGASAAMIEALRRMLLDAPPAAAAYFQLVEDAGELAFHLTEAILINRKPE